MVSPCRGRHHISIMEDAVLIDDVVYEDDDNFYKNEDDNSSKTEESTNESTNEVVDEASLATSVSISIGGFEVEESEEDESEMYTPEERLRMFSNMIMSCCVGKKGICEYALGKLLSTVNPRLFRGEDYIIFLVLFNYRSKIRRINIDEEFMRLYLMRNRNLITESREFIDIGAYGEVDGSVELGYLAGTLKHFRRLCSMPEMTESEFETCYEKYLIEFKAIESSKVYANAQQILTEGMKIGKKTLMGFEDSYNYVRRSLAEIEGLIDIQKGTGFISLREDLMEEKADTRKSYKISDFGRLSVLNKNYGGVYTGMFYEVLAPPKAGKTKFCARLVHQTMVAYGNNVTVWPQEGGRKLFSAQLRAIHFDHTYNTGVGITEKKYGVTMETIFKDEYPSDELRQLELSSKIDLISNPDYGNVDYIERPFNVETFLEDIDASVKANNSKLVVVDYLQIIGSTRNLSERERASEAYKELLNYCKDNNVAVLTPAQYKQEAFNDLLSKGNTAGADMRTSGGVTAEVFRTPDIIFAFWATTQDLANNTMKLLSVPCRFNKAFPESQANIDLGICQFISVEG